MKPAAKKATPKKKAEVKKKGWGEDFLIGFFLIGVGEEC